LPPREIARNVESMVCMKGMGPVETVLFDRIGDPSARSLVTDSPMPPVPFVSHMTLRTEVAMCSMSSSIWMTKQLDSCGYAVPALTSVEPAGRYSIREMAS